MRAWESLLSVYGFALIKMNRVLTRKEYYMEKSFPLRIKYNWNNTIIYNYIVYRSTKIN